MTEGYLIVQKSEVCIRRYINEMANTANSDYLARLRSSTVFCSHDKYRGISRYPISTDDISDFPFRDGAVVLDTLFTQLVTAKDVLQQLKRRDDYEIIRIFRDASPGHSGVLLGYDIGYWGGDCFSAICDSFIMPRWHPPALEAIETLAKQIKSLNQNLLFPDEHLAKEFYDYYIEQEWAEKPLYPGEIGIVGISYLPEKV